MHCSSFAIMSAPSDHQEGWFQTDGKTLVIWYGLLLNVQRLELL